MEVPKLDLMVLRQDLREFFTDPLDIDIMVYMYETTCQSESAKRLGVSQGLVRHRFVRSIAKMNRSASMQFYGEIFSFVSLNLNLLREVQRPFPKVRSGFVLDS